MKSMTSRQIHASIRAALDEVVRSLAAGEMDRSGRYYTDAELRERFMPVVSNRKRFRTLRRASLSNRSQKSG